jgi:hypothetical protein
MVVAAAAASVVGMSVAAAPVALAIGNDVGPTVSNGAGATSAFGNSATDGNMSPQLSLVEGTLNKPCLGLDETNVGVLQLVDVQDVPVLSDQLDQQCSDTSSQAERDGALGHTLENLSLLSSSREGS